MHSFLSRRLPALLLLAFLLSGLTLQAQTDAEAETEMAAEQAGVLPLEELRLFADVFSQIRASYVEDIDDQTLLENAIRGMLSGLDPHSNYLDKESFDDLQVSTSGEFGGLGLEVGMENGFVKVIAPIDDTPAERAGILSGDLIIKLDTQAVKGMSLSEAVNLMRGPRGSSIDLTILREGTQKPFVLSIVRDTIKVVSVRSKMLEPGFAYIRVAQFQSNTGIEFRAELEKLQQQHGQLKGLVLDLRNNPGGILQSSVQVADTFLTGGLIVYTEGRLQEAYSRYSADDKDLSNNTPLVVLINGGSASASEIVAGALQDQQRAVIMGTDSFGKGSVQTVIPLAENRAIKLTTARYFTPNGRSIQAQGISPDIVVERARIEALPEQIGIAEADLSGHLSNGNGEERNSQSSNNDEKEALFNRDNQLYEALNLLKGIHILSRKQTVKGDSASETL